MFRHLDAYTSFFFIAAGIGLFLAIALMIDDREAQKKHLPLFLIMAGFSLTLVEYVHMWSEQPFIPRLRGIWLSMPYLFGPCLLMYVHRLRGERLAHTWAHFLPLLLVLSVHIYIWTVPAGSRSDFFNGTYAEGSALMNALLYLRWHYVWLAYMSIYTILAARYAWSHPDVRYGKLVVLLFTGYLVALVSYYVLVSFPFFNNYYDYGISFMMTVFIYSIGLIMMKKPEWMRGSRIKKVDKYKGEQLPETLVKSVLPKLDQLMIQERWYTDADLRLQGVADELGLSIHTLSQLLNTHYGESFTQFVNRYRIAHAKELMHHSPALSVKEIAYQSGYNNPTSFYNNFKALTGMPPSEYLKSEVA